MSGELEALKKLSFRLGTDITRTQGAGGNVSVKRNGVMWVKASGTWLAHALERDIMVPVKTKPLLAAIAARDDRAEKATDFIVDELNHANLRPSIETSFHALIRQPVVAHFHCVNTIARCVVENGEAEVSALLASFVPELRFALIPYCRPGIPLAQEIAKVVDRDPDILVLQNHGIIIAGQSVDEVGDRIEKVTAALATPRRHPSNADHPWLEEAAEGSAYRLPVDLQIHDLAMDAAGLELALGGALYPDHIIFLGRTIGVINDTITIETLLKESASSGQPLPKLVVAPGKGTLLLRDLTAGGETMARCLAEVVTRIPEGAQLSYLRAEQEAELSNWEAEQYRQALDREMARQ
ncbi:class II aldolase/adducin family protein [Phyllobacterium bourgognense]|nr:class II aldolase/adducin family protein [Phyllobacterium bourgognense]